MKSLLRKHYLIGSVTLVVALIALGAFISFFSSMKGREHRVLEARDRLASFEQNRRVFSEEAQELETIKERIGTLEKNILTTESIPALLSTFETLAQSRALDFTITGVENGTATTETPEQLHIDFSASGSFTALQSFVQAILSEPYQVRFTRFSLYASNAGSATGTSGASGSGWQLLAGIDVVSF